MVAPQIFLAVPVSVLACPSDETGYPSDETAVAVEKWYHFFVYMDVLFILF